MASTLISLSNLALPLGCLHFIRSVPLTPDAVLLANDISSSDAFRLPLNIKEASPTKWEDTTAPVAASWFPISALQVVSPCRPPIRHNSKMLHCWLSGSRAGSGVGDVLRSTLYSTVTRHRGGTSLAAAPTVLPRSS